MPFWVAGAQVRPAHLELNWRPPPVPSRGPARRASGARARQWSPRRLDRCIFSERQMRPATFVVLEIIFQGAMQPGLVEDHDMVQAFAANRTDESLDIGILSWAAGRSECPSIWRSAETCQHSSRQGHGADQTLTLYNILCVGPAHDRLRREASVGA